MSETKLSDILTTVAGINSEQTWSEEERDEKMTEYANKEVGHLDASDGYNCDKCKNKGYIIKYTNGAATALPCKCQRIRNILTAAKRSGLGDVLKDCTFDKFIVSEEWQKPIKEKAQSFCKDSEARCFFIGGQSGAGKTHLCTAITGHFIKSGRDTRYMVWVEDAKRLKSLITDSDEYQKRISVFKSVDVLYIDDFFKARSGEQPTPADINLAFEILNHRFMNDGKITIISSEKTLDELCDYDEATMSRIYQASGQYITIISKDRKKNYRLKERK